ncbi:transposase, IS605 OrfB family [Methanosalsum zhilinae DSM 4017]|uniref:Transposase, IS605 OrfB family n=1 Tax=Methanosalsum zhilinae (strain DSM 4017 / NBRC 107636 / OCM 62 / WeN5) TaxID=679901 RepID=F7XKZ2_METZD|nr:IS200/IS605 family element RNA-guided endonuclease TnpB [Methanosalsum zhilinae]AEH60690.1 transposase, IS605 OrfB family [Methanosalsum zhilinae DSM 4017]AEH61805.1 transposase, IS605 OrfB family [Methanosalsum zhilinae DSM 4017]
MLKAYKYRLYPNKNHEEMISQHIGASRFIYNWALENKIKSYEAEGNSISRFALNKMIPELKIEHVWLKNINSQSLQGATLNLDNAFTKFFREKKGFPKFKSRKNPVQSFSVPQHYKVDFENNKIKLPKIGWINAKLHRRYEGKEKTATVSRTSTGKYYISILIDDEKENPVNKSFNIDTTVGVDVGIKDFAITSIGEKIDNPKYLKNSMKRMKVLQKRLSKKKKGSANRQRAKLAVAKLHEKIANQRNDFQHKLSSKLISENQAVALETLNVSGMLKNHCLTQSIADASWSSFVKKLEYKAEWYGKTILRIGRFEPSTKICNVCGYHNGKLTLTDRKWQCPDCKTNHDRDINAAINIKKFALDKQNLIGI